jgi:hypothetical protein
MLVQGGAQVACENDEVTPLGIPDTPSDTGRATPLLSVAVIMLTPLLACGIVIVPPFVNEKSKAGAAGTGATGGTDAAGGTATGGAATTGGVGVTAGETRGAGATEGAGVTAGAEGTGAAGTWAGGQAKRRPRRTPQVLGFVVAFPSAAKAAVETVMLRRPTNSVATSNLMEEVLFV